MGFVLTAAGNTGHTSTVGRWEIVRCRFCGEPRYSYRIWLQYLTMHLPGGRKFTMSKRIPRRFCQDRSPGYPVNKQPTLTCRCPGRIGPSAAFKRSAEAALPVRKLQQLTIGLKEF